MTSLEISFHFGQQPGEKELRALGRVRDVYGIWKVLFNEKQRLITIEYDASRLSAEDLTALLRMPGLS